MDNEQQQQQNDIYHFEQALAADLTQYLLSHHLIDAHLPDAPDLEQLWPTLAQAYLPDALREMNAYPVTTLGWMMYIGMAMARYWDDDWAVYSAVPGNLYEYMLRKTDYDHLDEYISSHVLMLSDADAEALSALVAECASRTLHALSHAPFEAGTPQAFRAFIAALHTLYRFGLFIELRTLGYHMTQL